MKRWILLILLASAGAGGWWLWQHRDSFKDTIDQYVENGEFVTLEARYTAEQLMNTHRNELLPTAQYAYQEPTVKFAPYLLLDAKYVASDKSSREGSLLWGLVDGEIVLDTETWELSHGFEDAINAGASRTDFRILFALAKNNGSMTLEQLQKDMHLEREILDPWISSAIKKHLIVQNGSSLQLHFQNPKIGVVPQTKIKQSFVRKPYNHGQRLSRKYHRDQIETIAQAAFGQNFTIRNSSEVFLPIYCLCVQNPDGSTLTSYWNALTGKQIQL